ncbi:MAG TPA: hypothetical protein DGG94_06225 [Micromonosporaceae bacterium]|nr:hypothetical protein [Micromonosporaceae bacterium]
MFVDYRRQNVLRACAMVHGAHRRQLPENSLDAVADHVVGDVRGNDRSVVLGGLGLDCSGSHTVSVGGRDAVPAVDRGLDVQLISPFYLVMPISLPYPANRRLATG